MIGLTMTAPMPAPSHRGSLATSCRGTDDARIVGSSGTRSCNRVASSSPSIPGISMSTIATSNAPCSSAASASSPEDAVVVSTPHADRSAVISRRFVALSSTMRARRPANDPSRRSAVGVMSVTPASNVTWKVLPSPGTPLLSAVTVPPISSASRRLIASPRPVPPNRRLVDASTCVNDWKSWSIRSGGIPIPVSRIDTWNAMRSGSGDSACSTWTAISPSSVNFTALFSRLSRIWRSRLVSPTAVSGVPGSIP